MPSTSTSQGSAEKAIRLLLAARKKSQAWLAAQLHVSSFWVNRRMSGVQTFNVDELDRIAAVFGLSLDGLLATADAVPVEEGVDAA